MFCRDIEKVRNLVKNSGWRAAEYKARVVENRSAKGVKKPQLGLSNDGYGCFCC